MSEQSESRWHADKRINISFLFGIAIQTLFFAYWIGGLSNRVDTLEKGFEQISDRGDRLVRVETQIENVDNTLERIELKFDRIIAEIRQGLQNRKK